MQIEVRNGAFHYPNGKSVLQSVNFSFDGRGVFAVLGPNGAGKQRSLSAFSACCLGVPAPRSSTDEIAESGQRVNFGAAQRMCRRLERLRSPR